MDLAISSIEHVNLAELKRRTGITRAKLRKLKEYFNLLFQVKKKSTRTSYMAEKPPLLISLQSFNHFCGNAADNGSGFNIIIKEDWTVLFLDSQ